MEELFITVTATDGKRFGELLMNILSDKSKVDFTGCEISYANDFNTMIVDRREEILDYIFDIGFTNFLRLESVNEAVVQRGTPQDRIVQVLQSYLHRVGIDNELILVDPFFYARTPVTNYTDFIEEIFNPFLPTIEYFIIVTTDNPNKIDPVIKADIENRFKTTNPGVNIIHRTSPHCHDRFIISHGREKGMLIGTSFNGLGNKLALIDRINTTDIRELVKELSDSGLL